MFKLCNYFMEEAGTEDKSGAGNTPKIYTEAEVAELVAGLKTNNEKLLAEKKETSRKAKEAEDARLLAEQEQAKNSGKLEEFEKSLRKQYDPVIAEKDGRIAKMSERILGVERKSVIASLSNLLIDESAADILGMMVRTEFDGDDVVTKFVGADGNVITTDPEQFKKYLKEHKAFSHLIKSDAASGGGASGNRNPNGGAGGDKLDAIDKRLREKFSQRG